MYVRPKKALGQHFLRDNNIAKKIVASLNVNEIKKVVEIGPGTGVLTQFLLEIPNIDLKLIEIDRESVGYLKNNYPDLQENILHIDFLKADISSFFDGKYNIIGNLPYNISSQIFIKIYENRNIVDETVCMIQKEVAKRIASPPGSKEYGILSVLLQAFFDIKYLFTVPANVFVPPPKVKSAVIKLKRNNTGQLSCNEDLFKKVIKATFNQRRKTIKNSLKSALINLDIEHYLLKCRPEQLSVDQFVELTNLVDNHTTKL